MLTEYSTYKSISSGLTGLKKAWPPVLISWCDDSLDECVTLKKKGSKAKNKNVKQKMTWYDIDSNGSIAIYRTFLDRITQKLNHKTKEILECHAK